MKIKFTFIALFIGYFASAQVNVKISEQISLQMPKGTIPYYNKEKIDNMLKIFSQNKKLAEWLAGEGYKNGDIIFGFHTVLRADKMESMDAIIKDWKMLAQKDEDGNIYFKSEKLQINSNDIGLVRYKNVSSKIEFQFICNNPKKSVAFTANITCNPTDEDKTEKMLKDIFKTIVISEQL